MPRKKKGGNEPPQEPAPPQQPSAVEMFKRRQLMHNLLLRNATNDDIWAAFQQMVQNQALLPIADVQLRRLKAACIKALEEQLSDNVHLERHKAKQRIQGHIQYALREKQFSAVASFERLLAEITGTLKPIEFHVADTTQAFNTALAQHLSQLSPGQLAQLADGNDVPLAPTGDEDEVVIETTGEMTSLTNGAGNDDH